MTREYQDLEYESSSQLLDHDAKWVLGRPDEAACHALKAARGRVRMGQLCFAAEEFSEAAEDWLSTVNCFLLANARNEARDILDRLHRMEVEGKIPAARPDLFAALRECEQGLNERNRVAAASKTDG